MKLMFISRIVSSMLTSQCGLTGSREAELRALAVPPFTCESKYITEEVSFYLSKPISPNI